MPLQKESISDPLESGEGEGSSPILKSKELLGIVGPLTSSSYSGTFNLIFVD